MGFFGDLNKLRIMGQEQEANLDVKKTMGDAKSRMDAMNAAYAAAAPKPDDPASEARRVDATATVQSGHPELMGTALSRSGRFFAKLAGTTATPRL